MTGEDLDYDDAMAVLIGWEGRRVLVVAFVEPGVSLRPFAGTLEVSDDARGGLRAAISSGGGDDGALRIVFPPATFHEASWLGDAERGVSIEQGATRVDVFLDD